MESFLSSKQVTAFKHQLHQRRAELLEEIRQELIRSDNEQYMELAGTVHDRGEESVADLLYDLGVASVDRHVKELTDIETALIRIVTGVFGICIECEGAVSYDRLSVNPSAKRCYDCQKHYEQRNQSAEEWHTL